MLAAGRMFRAQTRESKKQKRLAEKLTLEKGLEKWIYLVPGYTLDSLLKDRAQFLVEKKEEPKKEAPAFHDETIPLPKRREMAKEGNLALKLSAAMAISNGIFFDAITCCRSHVKPPSNDRLNAIVFAA